jgi:hypothetical protein
MLPAIFHWLDQHPDAYWAMALGATLLLFGVAIAPSVEPPSRPPRRVEFLWGGSLLLFLLAWRWPFLFAAYDLNPDEGLLVAGARTLLHDPVFWRSVDGTTSGPLNFYILLPFAKLGLPLDYFTARVAALSMIWVALIASYRLMRSHHGEGLARLSILPAAVLFATFTHPDLVHYSSEHLSVMLIALSAALTLGTGSDERRLLRARLWGAFLAGLLPWAKLQAIPIAAALVVGGAIQVAREPAFSARRKARTIGLLVFGALLPSVAILIGIVATGQYEAFVQSYLLQNVNYVGRGMMDQNSYSRLLSAFFATGTMPVFLTLSIAWVLLASGWQLRQRTWHLFAIGSLLTGAAVVSIAIPHRPFLHYLLLAIVPMTIWAGAAACVLADRLGTSPLRRAGLITLLIVAAGAPLGARLRQPPPDMVGGLLEHWRKPHSALGLLVRALVAPSDSVAVWGWQCNIFVEAGLPQGTRDPHTLHAIEDSPQLDYYRERYLADFRHNRPAVFVDAVGPGQTFFYDRTTAAHEKFPALADEVRRHYRLVADLGDARIYARADRFAERVVSEAERWRLIEKGRRDEKLEPTRVIPASLPRRTLNGQLVQMALPPAEIAWDLGGSERVARLEYGYDPRAYLEGRGDGTRLTIELQSPGVPSRLLLDRLVNPTSDPADRGPLASRIVLPPFKPGSRLIARTSAGVHGDNAWDWLYVGNLDCIRASFFSPDQFPRFNRVPDTADADLSYLLHQNDGEFLMLDAPAALTFNLDGHEHRLRFDYGFQEGAYSNGGHTDGATFVVELRRSGQPPQTLFSQRLDPIGNPDDRGRHTAELSLPTNAAGGQLVVRIGPGPSNAWDWTYVSDFVLE